MKRIKEFPFKEARRITPEEVEAYRKAIEAKLGIRRAPRMGRPPKVDAEKYVPVSVRLHPVALAWLKKQAKKRSLPYQTILNQILLKKAA